MTNRHQTYYERNKERLRAQGKAYYEANKDEIIRKQLEKRARERAAAKRKPGRPPNPCQFCWFLSDCKTKVLDKTDYPFCWPVSNRKGRFDQRYPGGINSIKRVWA